MSGIDISKISIRKASDKDFDFFYKLRCEYTNIFWTGHSKPPEYQKLKEWYDKTLSDGHKIIYIASYSCQDIGYLYLDIIKNNLVEIAIGISEDFQGKGLGYYVLNEFCKMILNDYNKPEINAWIFESNEASKRIFTKNGFYPTKERRKVFFPLKNRYETQVKYVYRREMD